MRILLLIFIYFTLLVLTTAQGFGGRPRGPPRFLQALPADIRARIEAIHENTALTREQRREQIHQIMESLPESVRANLPKPPGWERLPQATKDELEMIRKDRTLTFGQRMQRIKAVFEKLPPELRPPRPPHRGPPPERS